MTTPTNPGDSLSRRRKLLYILMLGALTALGPFTVDLYLPAFPALEESLGVSEAAVQLTLTGTTVGFALGQLVVGPLSDKFGRRMPLILATAVHIVASLGAALSTDIATLGFFRVLMGIGAAGGGVVAMAMVRDLFSGYAMVRMFSRMALVNGLAPILAPVIGSQLLLFMPWPGIFFFLAGYGTCVLIAAVFVVRETLPRELRGKTGHDRPPALRRAVRRPDLRWPAAGGRDELRRAVHLPLRVAVPVPGRLRLQPAAVRPALRREFAGHRRGRADQLRLIRKVPPQWILACSTAWMFLMAVLIVIFDQLGFGLWGVMVPLWFYILGAGFTFPCVQVLALAKHGAQAGTAASLLGAATFLMAGLVSPVVGWLGVGSATPMGAVQAACIFLAAAALWLVVRPRTVPAIQ